MRVNKILIILNIVLAIPLVISIFNSIEKSDGYGYYINMNLDDSEPVTEIPDTYSTTSAISLYTKDSKGYSALVLYNRYDFKRYYVMKLDNVYTDFYTYEGKIYLKPSNDTDQYLVINSDSKVAITDEETGHTSSYYTITHINSIDENTYKHHDSVNYNNDYICNISDTVMAKCIPYFNVSTYTLNATLFGGDF